MTIARAVLMAAFFVAFAGVAHAQQTPRSPREVQYVNAEDGTELTGYLSVPYGAESVPAVVLLSIAGIDPVTERLLDAGYAVLAPTRRGFVAVEPLLQATYADLGGDLRAALEYLGTVPGVDTRRLAVVAQADDAPPALLSMAAASSPVPLALLAPPAFSGVDEFRREQRAMARRDGARPDELRALDEYIDRIAEIALSRVEPYVREYRLDALRASSPVQLPRNAAFPMDARQAHFFASPLWRDRLAFEPQVALGLLRSPALVMIGADEANTPIDAYLDSIRRGLAAARTDDTTVCLVPGRTRHSFTPRSMDVLVEWLDRRSSPDASAPSGCLEDPLW